MGVLYFFLGQPPGFGHIIFVIGNKNIFIFLYVPALSTKSI